MDARKLQALLGGELGIKKFHNEYGEKFEIYYIKPYSPICFAADETDWKVLPLFNPKFGIWGADELLKLAKVLESIAKSGLRARNVRL